MPALSAAENQIQSLKHQLENTYQELEEAKKRHNAANFTITSGGLGLPRGSQSPVTSRGRDSSRVQREYDAAAAYSSRHSPTRARHRTSHEAPDSTFHQDHHDSAAMNSSRFRESLLHSATAEAAAGIEPFSPQAGHSHSEAHHLRKSLDSNLNQSSHQVQNSHALKEMEKRALAAEMKCDLLANQIKNMPASLSVANVSVVCELSCS